ncbi:uncharacterized protein METZ01_LOCUS186237 [marine metagenome]|uniref:LytR/CpsA/Psr regulator C-terminal domain-containing protein n=1 Tax=marine metagenome TaxID=408172 RepID=A0A382D717_9ZZZZ
MARRRSHLAPIGASKRKPLKVWFLEGAIVLLVGLNAYLLYSAMSPSGSLSSQDFSPSEPQGVRQRVQVEVLNGCGIQGISQQVRKYLRSQGFDVVYIANAENFDFPETVVLDRRGGREVSDESLSVATAMGTPHFIQQKNEDRLVDVTVVVGQDYRQLRSYEE